MSIENLGRENRLYSPSSAFAEAAEPIAFWERQAARLDWAEPRHTALTWEPATVGADGELSIPRAEWFAGGRIDGRDLWWHEVVDTAPDAHEPAFFDAETPLFIIYTSGTTGTPQGVVHTTGGYLTQASWSHWALFDAKGTDVYWCTADLAWVTAHT